VIEPTTQTAYVLVRAEVYDRMRLLVADDDIRLMEPYLAGLAPEDSEDLAHYSVN